MAKILQAVKKMTKFTKFLGFLGFLGLYRLFRGVGIGWAVFGSKRSTGCRDARLVGKWKGGKAGRCPLLHF